MTLPELTGWSMIAAPGSSVVYHTGDLASDRADERRPHLHKVAVLAMRLANEGRATLTQKRIDFARFEYRITLRAPAKVRARG